MALKKGSVYFINVLLAATDWLEGARSFHGKSANVFQKLHQVFCIPLKFGTLVDLTEKLRMQKIILKDPLLFVEL